MCWFVLKFGLGIVRSALSLFLYERSANFIIAHVTVTKIDDGARAICRLELLRMVVYTDKMGKVTD